nr:PREDICTED: uncharacterized protein LOC105663763 [Megachile rotundata]
MRKDRHDSKGEDTLKLFDKLHSFHVVSDGFPLLEDGIMGLPFFEQYQYNITNNELTLDGQTIQHETEISILPNETYTTKIPINEQFYVAHIYNPTNETLTYPVHELNTTLPDRIRLLKEKINPQHVDPELRSSLEKTIVSYNDVFAFENEELPCTNLTRHVIQLKTEKPINIKSHRPPETQHEFPIVKDETVSTESIADRFLLCRELCVLALNRQYELGELIGGPGVIVEIDERKIGRRKFERGRLREEHATVNHSTNFVGPESGAYIQNIESSWRVLRA